MYRDTLHGHHKPRFDRVADLLSDSLKCGNELGARVSIFQHGVCVFDRWGGVCDRARRRPWQGGTLVCMMSVTKAMASLCVLQLIDRGQLDFDQRVRDVWPEFQTDAQVEMTVGDLLTHRSGLFFADAAPAGSLGDWAGVCGAIARQPPLWTPRRHGLYQSFTHGFLMGELVRRVTGTTIGRYFSTHLATPLGADFHIGVTEADMHRVCDLHVNPANTTWLRIRDPATNIARAWRPLPIGDDPLNDAAFRQVEFPSANGHGNAASVAKIFAALACGGSIDGIRVLSAEMVERINVDHWAECELWPDDGFAVTNRHFRMGLGMFLASPNQSMGPNPKTFGHPGVGGSIVFADPDRQLSFAYSPNFMCEGGGSGARCRALVDAVYSVVA